jgi:putative peptide zinc metalloprotease protein
MALPEKPKLRDDLKIIRQVIHGEVTHVLKDPFSQDYYRFAEFEYKVLLLCSGERDVPTINRELQKAARLEGTEAPDEDEVKQFLDQADKKNLFVKTGREKNAMIYARLKEERKSRITSKKGSLIYKRFPMIDPYAYFTKIYPYVKFFFTPGFVFVSLVMMAISGTIVIANFDVVIKGVIDIITFQQESPWAYLQLWAVVMVVIALHEHAHGLTCHHFGGEVHEMGFLFLFFQPCMYANVSDAWTFADRGKRLWVTAAGGYFEFWIGSICTMLWFATEPGHFHSLMYMGMTVCGLSSVLFNFNPLIKLDGYYILSDLLETPNLKSQSLSYIKTQFKRHLFGLKETGDEVFLPREKRAFMIYGIASSIYVFFLLTGLWVMGSSMAIMFMSEFGLVLAVFLGYKMFGNYIKRFCKFLWSYTVTGAAT